MWLFPLNPPRRGVTMRPVLGAKLWKNQPKIGEVWSLRWVMRGLWSEGVISVLRPKKVGETNSQASSIQEGVTRPFQAEGG